MSNYKTYMWEILLIILGGLLTVGLSIMAVIKGNKQEVETKKYQEESRLLQEETRQLQVKLSEKSDQIISLNEELRRLTNSQTNELRRMTKKIPSQVFTLVTFNLRLNESERKLLHGHFAVKRKGQSNIITKSSYAQLGFKSHTLDLLFTSGLRLNLQFTGQTPDKRLNVLFEQQPIVYTEHPFADNGTFMLSFDDKFNLSLTGFFIPSVECNSNSHSLYDFDEYELSLNISFYSPVLIQDKLMYGSFTENNLVLEPRDFNFYFENKSGFSFKSDNFKEIGTNSYMTKGALGLE